MGEDIKRALLEMYKKEKSRKEQPQREAPPRMQQQGQGQQGQQPDMEQLYQFLGQMEENMPSEMRGMLDQPIPPGMSKEEAKEMMRQAIGPAMQGMFTPAQGGGQR